MLTCADCGHQNPAEASFCTQCRAPLQVVGDTFTLPTPHPYEKPAGPAAVGEELAPGSLFAGRYNIVDKIGQGGMGTVYRATEQLGQTTRELALKLIRTDRMADRQAIDRLMNEGVLTQDIRHENVVAVYNVGEAGEAPFVAMELVKGISLRDWIRRQQYAQRDTPPAALVVQIMRSVLDGLGAAHAKGVIHRDLKPENVILTDEPTVQSAPLKILDFGIARAPGQADMITGTGVGTPKYMAPEQITDPGRAGPPADLFSLSRMFYELLMGVLPEGFWQAPSGGRGDVSEALDKLILEGLGNAPHTRPQAVADYRARLDAAIGRDTPPPPPPPPPPPEPPTDEGDEAKTKGGINRKWLIGGGVAVLAVAWLADLSDKSCAEGDCETPVWTEPEIQTEPDIEPEPDIDPEPIGPGPVAPVLREATHTDFSGTWLGEGGSRLQLSVGGNGAVSGSYTGAGYSLGVGGSMANRMLVLSDGNGGQVPVAVGFPEAWCHPVLMLADPNTGVQIPERFHVNHTGGQPCPALYAE